MSWQTNPYMIPLLAVTVVSVIISIVAWQRRGIVPGAVTVTGLMQANASWACLYALELSTPNLGWQIIFAKLEYVGILSLPGLWLLFTLHYTRQTAWLTPLRRTLMLFTPIAFFLLVLTNDLHHLVWPTIAQVRHGASLVLQVSHGPGFWLIIIYSYLLTAGGALLLGHAWLEAPGLYRRQIEIMLVGALAPWIGNALYVTHANPFPSLDLTPFAFTITGLMATWGLLRYGLLELVPLARHQVVELIQEAMIVVDTRGHILDSNPAAEALLASFSDRTNEVHSTRMIRASSPPASQGSLGQHPWSEIKQFTTGLFEPIVLEQPRALMGHQLSQVLANWPELLALCTSNQFTTCDLALQGEGQERYFETQIFPVHARPDELSARLIVLREITERKQVEIELRRTRDLAEEASRAKSAFLATMSHELRTPLTVVIGYAEILHEEAAAQKRERDVLRLVRIESAAHHLLALVNDVLDLSKMEAGRMLLACRTFDLTTIINEAVGLSKPLIEQNHNRLKLEIGLDCGEINSDPTRVRQVLVNLLGNAAKFTQDGEVILRAQRLAGWIEFEVSDTGIGIPEEAMDKMFKIFSQVDPSSTRRYGGAGLGLAISQRLCHILGGEISVNSQAGVGSTFRIRLPLNLASGGETKQPFDWEGMDHDHHPAG